MPPLADLQTEPGYATVQFQVRDGEGEWQTINLDNPEAMKEVHDELRLSLTMPKYTIEGQPITYKVAEAEENKNDRLEYQIPGFEGTDDKDDYFAIKYDNTNATNHGSATDGVYSGGSVILTLTGTTEYEATKVWQDTSGDPNNRPQNVTLELWRYVAGQPLESAAAVRDSQGNIYTCPVSQDTPSGEEMTVTFHDKDAEGQPLEDPADFPKYDPEGNRYIYVVKEYGLSGNYTQVFGEVDPSTGDVSGDFIKEDQDEDGVVDNNYGGRESGNTYLYNGGTPEQRAQRHHHGHRHQGVERLCLPGGVWRREGGADLAELPRRYRELGKCPRRRWGKSHPPARRLPGGEPGGAVLLRGLPPVRQPGPQAGVPLGGDRCDPGTYG